MQEEVGGDVAPGGSAYTPLISAPAPKPPVVRGRRLIWLNPGRARAYALILATGFSIAAGVSAAGIVGGYDNPARRPSGVDFVAFRAVGVMALRGDASGVYRQAALEQEERSEAWIGEAGYFPISYPPPFLLLMLPLALLSYPTGYLAFIGGGMALLAALLSRQLSGRSLFRRVVPVFAFSGVLINVESGQNGLLTASAFAAGMLWLDRRPALGGACLGLLLCKPHLAIAVPWVLLTGRRWRALSAFALCGAALFAASILAFGLPVWLAFLREAPAARAVIEASPANAARMASLFSAARLLGSSLFTAYALHAAVAACALIVSWRSRRADGPAAVSLMVATGLLLTPYLFDYDLACLAVPLAWLLRCGARDGFLSAERATMAAALFLPLALRPVSIGAGIPLAPPVLCALLAIVARRSNKTVGEDVPSFPNPSSFLENRGVVPCGPV